MKAEACERLPGTEERLGQTDGRAVEVAAYVRQVPPAVDASDGREVDGGRDGGGRRDDDHEVSRPEPDAILRILNTVPRSDEAAENRGDDRDDRKHPRRRADRGAEENRARERNGQQHERGGEPPGEALLEAKREPERG